MMNNCNNSLNNLLQGLSKTTLVEKPCKVIKINSQYSVDIEYYDNNTSDKLYSVPVKHLQTSSAYIFLGLKVGDYGTVRFFDTNVSEYIHGKISSTTMERQHDINDCVFSYGFYPSTAQYTFPQGDIVIGTPTGATINISGETITINGGTIELGPNTTIDGKVFLEHTHSNGNNGNPTGKVI